LYCKRREVNEVDFSRLEENICDVIKEQQIKLGYRREVVRLYYPLLTLNRFLKTDLETADMNKILQEFCGEVEERLGKIEVSNKGERFCLCLPEEASEYVHNNTPHDGFIYDFIGAVSAHGATMDEVIGVFWKYSDRVHVEARVDDEFDYLVYFEDGSPDDFRYCLTKEGEHIIYHRYTREDFKDFAKSSQN
jgi:hypothetical protein